MSSRIDFPIQNYKGGWLPSFDQQTQSLDMVTANAEMGSAAAAFALTSVFTISVWTKYDLASQAGTASIFSWKGDPVATVNSVEFTSQFGSVDDMRVFITDATSVTRQNLRYDGVMDGGGGV